MDQNTSSSPIGVFDSGLGGLTVLAELLKQFPNENFIYLGDTARVPYGSKSSTVIHDYSQQACEFFLKKKKVKAIIFACNSASSHFRVENSPVPVPLIDVIGPGAKWAAQSTKNKIVGVLGTKATINSKSYDRALKKIDSEIQVVSQAAPLLVPLVEEGMIDDELTRLALQRYLSPLLSSSIDTLILACTHYPILRDVISQMTPGVKLVDSALGVCQSLSDLFTQGIILASDHKKKEARVPLFMTADSSHHQNLIESILKTNEFDLLTTELL